MEFRPCIDIHNGRVKQIVGGSLRDEGSQAQENFVSDKDGGWYADLYRSLSLPGGHVILLNPAGSPYYEATKAEAMKAFREWPGGLMAGGGIRADNAEEFLDAGASHVIVTSYVFRDGKVDLENLERMVRAVGRERLVLDLSCRRRDGKYYVVTDRWQKFTDMEVTGQSLSFFAGYCSEFLIHAADVEGKAAGVERPLVEMLARTEDVPMTYAGGVGSYSDLEWLKKAGKDRINVTIGSALDLFGGNLEFEQILRICRRQGV
jgi:phosphoribosylformimino-5-aminoimidazole carboxamide ribotide isomerase